ELAPLAEYFAGQRGQRLEPGALQELTGYGWPGNVRELRLAIERAGGSVDNGTLPPAAVRTAVRMVARRDCGQSRAGLFVAPEAARLIAACEAHGWDTRSAAASLGIARSTLYYRLKASGVSPRESRRRHLEFHWNSMEF